MNPGTLMLRDSLIKSICKGWISWFLELMFSVPVTYIPDLEHISLFMKEAS